jgi:hypothetical protein
VCAFCAASLKKKIAGSFFPELEGKKKLLNHNRAFSLSVPSHSLQTTALSAIIEGKKLDSERMRKTKNKATFDAAPHA